VVACDVGAYTVDVGDKGWRQHFGGGPARHYATASQDEHEVTEHRGKVEVMESDDRGHGLAGHRSELRARHLQGEGPDLTYLHAVGGHRNYRSHPEGPAHTPEPLALTALHQPAASQAL
jgi:hypothetical protein